jgi:ketosteroid isomerase-like protein
VSAEDEHTIRTSIAAFNARDLDGLLATCDPECEWHPLRAQLEDVAYRGHDGVQRFLEDLEEDWGDLRVEPLELLEANDRWVVTGRLHARGRGSGVEIETLIGCDIELRGGRIARLTGHSDPEAALRAASAERAAGSGA